MFPKKIKRIALACIALAGASAQASTPTFNSFADGATLEAIGPVAGHEMSFGATHHDATAAAAEPSIPALAFAGLAAIGFSARRKSPRRR
jgi:hypothetical protein